MPASAGNCPGICSRRCCSRATVGACSCTAARDTEGRVYTSQALRALGLPAASDLVDAARRLAVQRFAYLPLEAISPRLADMLGLRPILGLRSPVHTFARLLNPFGAPTVLQGVFHPAYMALHRDAAMRLGESSVAVFRGEGGEIERRPNKPCEVVGCKAGVAYEETWPPMLSDPRLAPDEQMDLGRLLAVWEGREPDAYAEAAVIGTAAVALRALGVAGDPAEAERMADRFWRARDRARLIAA